jgi:hypothetical protein
MRSMGRLVEKHDRYRLYETFAGGGAGTGCIKASTEVNIRILVDSKGPPLAVSIAPANQSENRLIQELCGLMLSSELPQRVIGDKAYGCYTFDEEVVLQTMEPIRPNRADRHYLAGRPR